MVAWWHQNEVALNFHQFKMKNLNKCLTAFHGKETKRKVVQLNYILSFIFNFVPCIIYIANFQNSVALSHIGCSNLNFWWPWSVLTRHWRLCNCQFLALFKKDTITKMATVFQKHILNYSQLRQMCYPNVQFYTGINYHHKIYLVSLPNSLTNKFLF